MTQASWWCERAWLPDGPADAVRLVAVDGRLTTVAAKETPHPEDVALPGLTLPGLANTHSHAFHRALRGRTHGEGGTFWTWRTRMYQAAAALDPDLYYTLATAVYSEMVAAGYTVVGEFHYLHHAAGGRPYADPNVMGEALIAAAATAGIRITLLDTAYLAGGLTADGYAPLAPEQARFGDGDAHGWARRVSDLAGGPTARIGAAIHSVRAVPADQLAAVADVARAGMGDAPGEAPLHVHLSEQPAENEATLAAFGRTPTALLAEHGVLGPHTCAVHATHLTQSDIEALGASATTACFCSTTERDLADGIGPSTALAAAGSPLALGSDQHAVIDPFEEARGLELNDRLATGRRGRHTPAALMAAASANGYAALGWDGGLLAPGSLADWVTVDLTTARTAGADPAQIAFAATAADVSRVVVDGRTVAQNGEAAAGQVGPMLRDAIAALDARVNRA